MIITRNTIAKLLETTPSNIKTLKQVGNNIYIKLADLDLELSMTVQEYQNCRQQLRCYQQQIDSTKFLTIMIIIGTFLFMTISSINTDLANYQDSQNNTQLVSDE
jgi:hypothetical protein